MSLRIERLSELGGHQVAAHCPSCQHHEVLDATAIMVAQGDLRLAELPSRLRCTRCGHKPCSITLHGPESYSGPLYQPH